MKNCSLFLLIAALYFVSCTPKTTEEVVEEPVVEIETPQEPENPCVTFARLTPSEKDQAETAYVLYKDQYDFKNYDKAMPLWRKAYGLAPAANGRVKYQFDHGVKLYNNLYNTTEDPELKKTYVDTVMMIYDKRVECFGDAPYIAGRKAFDYYYYYPGAASEMEVFDLFSQALNGKGKKADYFIVNPMTKLLVDNYHKQNISLQQAQDVAAKLAGVIEYGTSSCEQNKNCDTWEIINSYAPDRLESFEAVDGFYDCQYYSDKYYPLFQQNPTDCENILFVSRRMIRGGCDKEGEKLMELKRMYNENCYTPPPPPGPCSQGNTLYNEGNYKEAISMFEECLKGLDNEKQAKYKLLIAKIYYRDLKNFPKSRKYALEAAQLKPNWGDPYMLIGKLYASSGPLCGPGTGWDSQVVTWPAIDKWKYAKKIDPNVAAEANQLIGQYKKYMPKKEDIFLRSLKTGQAFTVPCWIQEKTTIRTSD